MEMGWCVVREIHQNDNSVKEANLWHNYIVKYSIPRQR